MQKKICAFLGLALILQGCASSAKETLPPVEKPLDYASEEALMGQKIHQEIMQAFYPYTDPKVVAYVNRIGQSLAIHAHRKELLYRFMILYNDKIYATSAPGGYVYLTTGMLYFLQSESELAAVIAHEIGELQYKEPKLSQKRKFIDAVTQGGMMVTPVLGPLGPFAMLGLAALHTASDITLKDAEQRLLDADKKALQYMVQAGQDPQGMLELVTLFAEAKPEILPYFLEYYQSRPLSVERTRAIQEEFAKLPLAGKSFTANAQEYQDVMRGVREMYKF
jgi:predicted Zn-dependent protease